MAQPTIERDGDTWVFSWDEHGVGMGVERLRERADSLKAEVTVESTIAGRVAGPNTVDLLSARSQAEFANQCAERVNGLSKDVWRGIVVQACARVARDYRQPQPTVAIEDIPEEGPVDYLIPRLLPKGETTLLYGDGESLKSLLALRLGFSVATGQDVPWGHAVGTTNVLYLDWETNAHTIATRLRRVARGMCMPLPPNIYYTQCLRSIDDELPHIREQISRKQIGLVIVDSVGFAASGALNEDLTARSALNALRHMGKVTRLVIAHVSKGSAENATGPSRPFGSVFFWNGMRSGVEVRRAEDQPTEDRIDIALYHRKSNDGRHARPIGLSVSFDGDIGNILFEESEISDVPDLAARASLSERIREVLKRGQMNTREIAEELEAKEDSVLKTLKRMSGKTVVQLHGIRGQLSEWGLHEANGH